MHTAKALAWARAHGLSPVPLAPPIPGNKLSGKRPTDSGWLARDYQDVDFPEGGNVGIHTGRSLPQGGFLLVVDIDAKEGKSGNEQWLDFCCDEGIDLPPTLTVRSGSGGYSHHLYFRTTEQFRDTKLDSCPDIEFKGLGGQVVAAHSVHYTGGTYIPEEAEIAWAPIELENVLRAAMGGGKNRIQTDEQVFAQEEVYLDEPTLKAFVKKFPGHQMSKVFRDMLAGKAFSSPGHRHQDIRLGLLPQILAALGANLNFDSLEWAFRGDYPEGFDRDTSARMYDALRTGARKVDPEERKNMEGAAQLVKYSQERVEAAAVAVRAEVAEALASNNTPDPTDPQTASLLAQAYDIELDKNNRIKNHFPNIVKILEAFFSHRLRMNVRTGAYEVRNLPWDDRDEWRSFNEGADTVGFAKYFHTRWGVPVPATVLDAILKIASANIYDPVVEYLQKVSWDGEERALDLFVRAVGAQNTEHTKAVTRCFLVGAVARAMQPGCKLDTQLILSGPQGARKSTFFRTLCADPRWFSDTGRTYGEAEKDFLARLHTLWIWEDSELQASTRDEAAKKAFLSKTEDTFRPPYARLNVRSDRRFVCAGSTNEDEILYDPTGSRRYHILVVQGKIDIEYVESLRDQIWAEAVRMYESGVKWWLSDSEQEAANKANEEFRSESPAESAANKIVDWFERKRRLDQGVDQEGEKYGTAIVYPGQFTNEGRLWCASFAQISDALHLTPSLVGKAVSVLKRLGWEKTSKVRVMDTRLMTSLCVKGYEKLRDERKEYLLARFPKLKDLS